MQETPSLYDNRRFLCCHTRGIPLKTSWGYTSTKPSWLEYCLIERHRRARSLKIVESAIGALARSQVINKDLGFPERVERPTLTLLDNINARDWANESMITDGNRQTCIDRRYMLIREKINNGIMAVVWASGDWNISDLGTKPTDTPTTQRLVPIICGQAELPIPAGQKILFGPVDKPVRRESTNLAIALKSMTNTEA